MNYFVYIVANKTNNLFFVGTTNNLGRRIYEHKHNIREDLGRGSINKLVYYKSYNNIDMLIEAKIKVNNWVKQKKLYQIKRKNPNWDELLNI